MRRRLNLLQRCRPWQTSYQTSDSCATVMAPSQTLFPSIGTVADQTDNLQAKETDGNVGDPASSTFYNEEKVVQEVESLCEVFIPSRELELTIPPTNRGQLTTVEGLLRDVVTDLSKDQLLG